MLNWGEPERAPPSQFNGCAVYIFISHNMHRTSSTRDHLFNTCTVYSRSQIKTFVPRPTLDGDSSRGWYGLPGRSAERSQASGVTARINIARLEWKQTCERYFEKYICCCCWHHQGSHNCLSNCLSLLIASYPPAYVRTYVYTHEAAPLYTGALRGA